MRKEDGDLIEALISQVYEQKRLRLDREQLAEISLPVHLQVKISVVDTDKNELALSTSIEELREKLLKSTGPAQGPGKSPAIRHELEVTGITDWSIGDLPRQVEIGDDLIVVRFPALVDEGDSVAVALFVDESEALHSHRAGLLKLFMLRSVQQRNMLRKQFSRFINNHALKMTSELKNLGEDAVLTSYATAFQISGQDIRDKTEFEQALQAGKSQVISCGEQIERLLTRLLDARLRIRRLLETVSIAPLLYLKQDIEQQLSELIFENFLSATGLEWFREMPRYLEAIELRLGKVPLVGDKDKAQTELVQRYWQQYLTLKKQAKNRHSDEVQQLRWMIEELRVSLFAQTLGTRVSVYPSGWIN